MIIVVENPKERSRQMTKLSIEDLAAELIR
ncbi:GntR family transcriptional regulator, partial [Listeria monocytogenes]|nr:GntR family transcriptional regulator [Listeria monocytogenes]